MNADYLKEKANCLRNEMNHLWTGMFITSGGAVGFSVLQEKDIWIYCFIVAGFFLASVFLNAYMLRRIELLKILDKLNNGEN